MFIFAVVKFTVAEVELLQMWTAKGDDGKCTSVKLFYVNKRQTDMGKHSSIACGWFLNLLGPSIYCVRVELRDFDLAPCLFDFLQF